MSEYSFGIRTSLDFFKKLLEDHNDYLMNVNSSRLAVNCAMTGWHLIDWVYNEHKKDQFKSIAKFKEDLKSKCKELEILQDITLGTKHYSLTTRNPLLKETKLSLDDNDYVHDHCKEYNISMFNVVTKEGNIIYFDAVMLRVIEFWEKYFKEELKLNTNIEV
jgi:hypothetical protein